MLKQTYPELRYVNLDAYENREWLRDMSSFDWAKSVGTAIIDEAQKEPSVFEKVKYAFDDGSLSFTALSGSAQFLLLSRVRESLAGRAFAYELWPLIFCELAASVLGEPLSPPLIESLGSCVKLDDLFSSSAPTLSPERNHLS